MSGGDVRGWTPDVAAILWRRMLSALGDVNTLENPLLHEQVFQYLLDLSTTMTKVNQLKLCHSLFKWKLFTNKNIIFLDISKSRYGRRRDICISWTSTTNFCDFALVFSGKLKKCYQIAFWLKKYFLIIKMNKMIMIISILLLGPEFTKSLQKW